MKAEMRSSSEVCKAAPAIEERASRPPREPPSVSWHSLRNFVFTSNLEHPESTGRLELFARYGPTDEHGILRGGIAGTHAHTDHEIHQMILRNCREALSSHGARDSEIDFLMPLAMAQNYTEPQVKRLLRRVPRISDRLNFSVMQDVILESQEQRLRLLLEGRSQQPGMSLPFQSRPAASLMASMRKKKLNEVEEQFYKQKLCNNYCALVAPIEKQNGGSQLVANVTMCRSLGGVEDRWDRYCAIRRAGRASYVRGSCGV